MDSKKAFRDICSAKSTMIAQETTPSKYKIFCYKY